MEDQAMQLGKKKKKAKKCSACPEAKEERAEAQCDELTIHQHGVCKSVAETKKKRLKKEKDFTANHETCAVDTGKVRESTLELLDTEKKARKKKRKACTPPEAADQRSGMAGSTSDKQQSNAELKVDCDVSCGDAAEKTKKKRKPKTEGIKSISENTDDKANHDTESSDRARKKPKKKKKRNTNTEGAENELSMENTDDKANHDTECSDKAKKKLKKKKKRNTNTEGADNELIPENTDDKTNHGTESSDKAEREPRKKKKRERDTFISSTEFIMENPEDGTNSDVEGEVKKKKKRRKTTCAEATHIESTVENANSCDAAKSVTEAVSVAENNGDEKEGNEVSCDTMVKEPKKKKKRRKATCAEVIDIESTVENSNSCDTAKSVAENNGDEINRETSSCDTIGKKPKKKKRRTKPTCAEVTNIESTMENANSCDTAKNSPKKKKKGRTHEVVKVTNNQSITEATGNAIERVTVSCDTIEKKPKKKVKTHKGTGDANTESISGNANGETMCDTGPCTIVKKKSKKRKKEQPESSTDSSLIASKRSSTECDPDVTAKEKIKKRKKKEKLREVTLNNPLASEENNTTQQQHEDNSTTTPSRSVQEAVGNGTPEQLKHTNKRKRKENDSAPEGDSNSSQSAGPTAIKAEKKRKSKHKDHDRDGATPGAAPTTQGSNLGQWGTAELSDGKQQKFVRLLGGMRKGGSESSGQPTSNTGSILSRLSAVCKPVNRIRLWGNSGGERTFSSMALNATQSESLATKLEGQFNNTLAFNLQKNKEGNKSKGLGFQEDPAKGKKHHIDIEKRRSILL